MTLRGIDISSYQAGINLAVVPLDFAIVKATQGKGYVNPDCARAVDQLLGAGRLAGVYMYVSGGDANGEADFFVDQVKGWVGRVVLAVDWESGQNGAWGDLNYLDAVVKRIIARTGVKPLVYASSSAFPWDVAKRNDCGTWVAQYADMNATGYQDTPWNDDRYGCVIRQYSSSGYLPGWGGALDLNKFYGDRTMWMRYAAVNGKPQPASQASPAPAPSPMPHVNYALHEQGVGWLPTVHDFGGGDDGYAGNPNHRHDMLWMNVTEGDLRYRVHVQGGEWLSWVNHGNPNDTVNGCAGMFGRTIDAVQAYYTTPAGRTLRQAWYRSQTTARAGWLNPCCDDGTSLPGYDGFAGVYGEPLDRLQISINDHNPF